MALDASSAALVIVVLCVAGFTQGLTGFGFGLVAMALLPLILEIKSASFLVVVFNLLVAGTTLYANRRHFSWRRGRALIVGTWCGVPLGVYLLVAAPRELLIHLLGGLLVLFCLNDLLLSRRDILKIPASLGFPLGLLSGSIGGAFNMGGPPAVAYVYSQPWTKEEIVTVLQVSFGTGALLRLILLGMSHIYSPGIIGLTLWGVLPVFASILLGTYLFRRLSQERLRTGVFIFLGIMGVKYLFFSG